MIQTLLFTYFQMAQEDQSYILSKEDYQKLKGFENSITKLEKDIKTLKSQSTAHIKYKNILEEKLIIKNSKLFEANLKFEYLNGLIDQMNQCVKLQNGVKQMSLSQSHYSVIRSNSQQIDIDEKLPQHFDKNQAFQKVDLQLENQRDLVQKLMFTLQQKQKEVKYYETEIISKKKQIQDSKKSQLPELTAENFEALKKKNNNLEAEVKLLRAKVQQKESQHQLLRKQNNQCKNLKVKNQKLEKDLKDALRAIQNFTKAPIKTQTKTKLMSMISEYVYELKKSYSVMDLTKEEQRLLIQSEIKDVQSKIEGELKKL